MIVEEVAYCVDGCGRPATTERPGVSVIGDGVAFVGVELVCAACDNADRGTT